MNKNTETNNDINGNNNTHASAGATPTHPRPGQAQPALHSFPDHSSAWAKVVSGGGALLDALESTLRRHVILPDYAAETLALWALHTYAFELRHVTTYIGIESPEK